MTEHMASGQGTAIERTSTEAADILNDTLFDAYREIYRDIIINGADKQKELDGVMDMLEGKYHKQNFDTELAQIEQEVWKEKNSQAA